MKLDVNGQMHAFKSGDFFGIDPFDMHSFLFEEDTTLVSMYSDGVEKADGTKDIYTE